MVPPQPPPASASPLMTKIQQISRGCSRRSPTGRGKPAALGLPAEEQLAIQGDPAAAGEQQHERRAEEQEVGIERPAAGSVMDAGNHNEADQKAREQQAAE